MQRTVTHAAKASPREGVDNKVPAVLAGLCRAAAVLLVSGILAACGGGGSETPPAVPPAPAAVPAGQVAQQTLGAAGGTVTLSSSDGAVFVLSLPAGALPGDTTVALTTATATASQRFHLQLTPTGTVFTAGQSATLTIALPPGMAVPGALFYDGVPIPFTTLPDGRLQVQLSRFAGTAVVASLLGRARALLATVFADGGSAPCGGIPQIGNAAEGGLTAGDTQPSAAYGACMVSVVNQLAATGAYEDAVRLANVTAGYLQSVGTGDPGGFIAQASSIACIAYRNALDNAAGTTVGAMGLLHPNIRAILFWETAVQQLGATCPQVGATEYQGMVTGDTDEALAHYAAQQPALTDVTSTAYGAALAEARAASATVAQVLSLRPSQAVTNLLNLQIVQRAQPGLLEAMLPAAWQRCRGSGNLGPLIDLMDSMDKPQSVKHAAQYCATQLSVQARDNAGTVTATLDPTLGGVAAGNQRTSGAIAVQKDGRLALSGPIRALQCPAGSAGGSERLEIRLNGTLIQTVTSAPYLASTLEIDIAQALQTAGINASTFTTGTLTFTRAGSPCNGYWGDNPQTLLTVTISSGICVPPAGYNFCIQPITRTDGSAVDPAPNPWAAWINDQAEVLFKSNVFGDTDMGARVWRKGEVRDLPAGFGVANVRPRLNNQGVAVGLYRGTGVRNDGDDAGVALPDGTVKRLPLPDYPAGMRASGRSVRFETGAPAISDSGTVIGAAMVFGSLLDNNAPPTGCRPSEFCYYGYILKWEPPYDNYTIIEGPIYMSDAQLVYDIDPSGKAVGGRVTALAQQAVPYQWNPAATVGQNVQRGWAFHIDDRGAIYYVEDNTDTQTQTTRVTSMPPHMPGQTLTDLRGLDKSGFAQVCGPSTGNQLKLVHVYDGREWLMTAQTLVDPALGWDFAPLLDGCFSWGLGLGEMNRHGHWLVHAARNGVFTPAILTPRGQPLP